MVAGQLPSVLGLAGGAASVATAAGSDVLYGVNSADDGLSFLNETTGASTFVGRLSPDTTKLTTPIALAARPSDKQLFAWNNSDTTVTGDLVSINTCTGLGTKVN